jgi:cell division protein FtsQ
MDKRIRERRLDVARSNARRRRRVALSVIVAALLAGGGLALSYSPLFAVDHVRVTGVESARDAEVVQAAAVREGEPLLSVDLDRVAGAVRVLPWVRSAEVVRVPPSTVEVRVAPREPVLLVRVGPATWELDADGVLIAGGGREGVPVVEAPAAVLPPVGEVVRDAAVQDALGVHLGLTERLRVAVGAYEVTGPRSVRARLVLEDAGPDGLWVRFGDAERVARKAAVIELLLAQTREQASRGGLGPAGVAEVDVRAPDNPVLIPRR